MTPVWGIIASSYLTAFCSLTIMVQALHAYNLSGDGYILDAFVLAGRLDYAVAANLNLFGSFFWAQRNSDGYEWGCLRPEIDDDTPIGLRLRVI